MEAMVIESSLTKNTKTKLPLTRTLAGALHIMVSKQLEKGGSKHAGQGKTLRPKASGSGSRS
ncbi:hypothetical protein [Endozoicomonas sp. ALE010]|uniref:hypothetical protein n=1 Tax=Endozoicomonas sp. ALE010 TaxID=3403081 RepID=UPI003BB7F76F